MALWPLLQAYWKSKRLRFQSRADLERYQTQQWQRFEQQVLTKSRYFQPFIGQPLLAWPLMNKAIMLQHFNAMNTVGMDLQAAFAVAQRAEQERDFAPTLNGISVGLSSGTSASRGVFVVSPAEQARWAGTILAKLLPQGLLSGERVALVLRANNNLYERIDNRFIAFRFFDLLQAFDDIAAQLQAYRPSIIVAPAQVLRALALAQQQGHIDLQPKRVISAAEVLSDADRAIIETSFPELHQVYQATEGFLAVTCEHRRLHLNEEFVMVEQEWLDDTRYVPIITDFTRSSQPIIRYRLDDVLHHDDAPCPCGRVTRVIKRIEGRLNDVLRLPKHGAPEQTVALFADALERIIAQHLPMHADYQLTQTGAAALTLQAQTDASGLHNLQAALQTYLDKQGVAVDALQWDVSDTVISDAMVVKRRRIKVQMA